MSIKKKILIGLISFIVCFFLGTLSNSNLGKANDYGFNLSKPVTTKQFSVYKRYNADVDDGNNSGNNDDTNHSENYAHVNKQASKKLDNYLIHVKNLKNYTFQISRVDNHNSYDNNTGTGYLRIYETATVTFVKK